MLNDDNHVIFFEEMKPSVFANLYENHCGVYFINIKMNMERLSVEM